ncbi:HAD-IIIA family hydrolase [Knoellia sp. CPCC 206435]|uniref:HAD-IIIA family hydrolase n=1 Tax=Knoellia terrae TaxID=3404797 RepID=UPI003B428E97
MTTGTTTDHRPTRRPGVLLDRDGTIIEDSGYVGRTSDVRFLDGAIEAIARLNAAGVPVAVVTNQAGVARGFYELEDVHLVHKHMAAELASRGAHVDLWLFCPYHPDGIVPAFARSSADRKPGPGMALAAADALALDLASSWVVGDSACDVGLARAAGARALWIDTSDDDLAPGVRRVPDLVAAVDIVLTDLANGPGAGPSAFPTRHYATGADYATEYSNELARAVAGVDPVGIETAARILSDAYRTDRAVFTCGNGGSASIANHFQCDHEKGVRTGTGLTTRVASLSTNVEILSAIANDIGYDVVFEYQLESQARPGDVLVVVSSSGRSPNVVRALQWARAHGMATVAMTGFTGGPARELADASIHVDSHNYGVVEDSHQACMHLLAQYVRQSLMSDADVAAQVF